MAGLALPAASRGIAPPSTGRASGTSDPWVFNVRRYGAKGDGVTDDTAAINAAVAAAFTYATANETCYAEVYIPPSAKSYILAGATTKTSTYKGNAQIPIPLNAAASRKITLVIRGAFDSSAMPHWNQTTGQRWGSTLKCTLTGQTNDGTWGAPSIIGGPTPQQGYGTSGTFNNVYLVIDGIGLSYPLNPTVGGLDGRGMAQMAVRNCAMTPDAQTSSISNSSSNSWTFGYLPPANTNNDLNYVSDLSIYGQYTGLGINEHLWADRVACIYCHDGLFVYGNIGQPVHSAAMGAISVEGCTNAVTVTGSGNFTLDIAALTTETISGTHLIDSGNALHGQINWTLISGSLSVTGGANCRIIQTTQTRGLQTPPAVPASTVAAVNPFWRDATVQVVGGTVTEVTVDGQATGLTSGFFPVRSGGSIAITYSSAPTWRWWTT